MKIVITGSLGNISKSLAEKLLREKHDITVISSNPRKQEDIKILGAIPAIGSVEDDKFLTKIFTGADAVYCMIPPNFKEIDQISYYKRIGESYAGAIAAAGIKRLIHLSSYGAHLSKGTGFITGSYEVEQLFNQLQNLQVTHIRPGFFYYNLYRYIDMIKEIGCIGTNFGQEDRLILVSPYDIAMVISEELVKTGSIERVRYVASDERTCNEIASVLGEAIGMAGLTWEYIDDQTVMKKLINSGMPASAAEALVELGAATHKGLLREDIDIHPPRFGRVKLEEFAKEFARVYHSRT
ncbi:NAD-dependent dehydratase [Chitinophaga caeni]|uniref:NAD-dependent dehydratase n=1 Tax=Chitinophaga caeni TaxID=2029983 RepID=A0A291QZU3_9BACT|nr:NmrA family NAD(P)-binding protein [Chitinophaga caeni]ATL49363.1 NAD-dependent dehydratase [Chitinophaga caeni]